MVGVMRNPLAYFSIKRSKPDEGSVGSYKSSLDNGVTVELAASNHAGFYQYTFPSNSSQNTILVDVSHVLNSFRGTNWGQTYQGGSFTLAPDGHYEGSGIYNKGWNLGKFVCCLHRIPHFPSLRSEHVGSRPRSQTMRVLLSWRKHPLSITTHVAHTECICQLFRLLMRSSTRLGNLLLRQVQLDSCLSSNFCRIRRNPQRTRKKQRSN